MYSMKSVKGSFKILFFLFSSILFAQAPLRLTNLKHLDFLSQIAHREGEKVLLTHIYCEYPDYQRTDALGEGIACVDDVARAALVYMKNFLSTQNQESLQKARYALNFVMQLQAPDGEFYNFVYADFSINKKGNTSKKSTGFWAARGLWALSTAYGIFQTQDPQYARRLNRHIQLTICAVQRFLAKHQETRFVAFKSIPLWMIEQGSDCWSIFLIGFVEYYRYHPDKTLLDTITQIADAISEFQSGDFNTYPWNAHLSWGGDPHLWHGWGNRQTAALAFASRIIPNKKWLLSAQKEAAHFYTLLLSSEILGQMTPEPQIYEQIAYTVSPMVQGLLELSETTKEPQWAKLAGLMGSWFLTSNPLKTSMYNPETGRCFDGLCSCASLNLNSGAESTIEALMAMLDIEKNPIARNYLSFHTISAHSLQILSTNQQPISFFIQTPGDYLCYLYYKTLPNKVSFFLDQQKIEEDFSQAYPAFQAMKLPYFLATGPHSFAFPINKNPVTILLLPILQTKIWQHPQGHVLIMMRDSRKEQVILWEQHGREVLNNNLEWKKF